MTDASSIIARDQERNEKIREWLQNILYYLKEPSKEKDDEETGENS